MIFAMEEHAYLSVMPKVGFLINERNSRGASSRFFPCRPSVGASAGKGLPTSAAPATNRHQTKCTPAATSTLYIFCVIIGAIFLQFGHCFAYICATNLYECDILVLRPYYMN